MAQSQHDILKALVFSSNHPECDQVAKGVWRDIARISTTSTGNIGSHTRSFGGFLHQPPHGGLAHPITLSTRKDGLSCFPRSIFVALQLARGLWLKVEIGVALYSFLETTWEEELRWIGSKIDAIPVKRDKLADAKTSVREQRDNYLVTPLEVGREGVGEAGVTDLLNLLRGEPGRGLFPSMSA